MDLDLFAALNQRIDSLVMSIENLELQNEILLTLLKRHDINLLKEFHALFYELHPDGKAKNHTSL